MWKVLVPFAQTKGMTFSRSFKFRVEIIHFYAMFRNMNQTVHIEIKF